MNNTNINLSKYTEVGTIVDIGPFKIRLLDTNYNNSGLKVWQTVDVLFPKEVRLDLLGYTNGGGFPTAKGLLKALDKFHNELPENIRKQLVETSIPCYKLQEKKIEFLNSYVFLLSATEMCQNAPWSPCEGRPLEYYIHNSYVEWKNYHWLRTPSFDKDWIRVDDACIVDSCYDCYILGIAPAFCTK